MEHPTITNGGLQYVPQITAEQQIVYLDFDGAETQYNNSELELKIDVSVENSGLSEKRIKEITDQLNLSYTDQNVLFVSTQPIGTEYSTIYIGKSDDFEPYGEFYGLAETVDTGNLLKDDNAFVLLDQSYTNTEIISVINHEIGHIVDGATHENTSPENQLSSYALDKLVSTEKDTCDVVVKRSGGFSPGSAYTIDDSWYCSIPYGATKAVITITNDGIVESYGYERCYTEIYATVNGNTYTISNKNSITITVTSSTSINFSRRAAIDLEVAYADYIYDKLRPNIIVGYRYNYYSGYVRNTVSITANYYNDIPIADLTVVSAELSRTDSGTVRFDPTESFNYTFTVKNTGDLKANGSKAFIYVDNRLYTEIAVNELNAGESQTLSYTFSAGALGNGEHNIYVLADGYNVVNDADRSNNTSSKTQFIVEPAKSDLSATFDMEGDESGTLFAEQKIAVAITVTNHSGNKNSTETTAALYVGDTLITMLYIPVIEAGKSINLRYNIPADTLPMGNATFKLVLDPDNRCSEFDEGNNTASVTKSVIERNGVILLKDELYVNHGASFNGLTLRKNGTYEDADVYKNGVFEGGYVSSGGQLNVLDGGVANNTTVYLSGTMEVSSGGVASSPTVSSGGMLNVYYKGSVSGAYIGSSGTANIEGFADSLFVASRGMVYNYMGNVKNASVSGTMRITSGVANNTEIPGVGRIELLDGGIANNTLVDGSYLFIYTGGVANNTSATNWAFISLNPGGVVNNTTLKGHATHLRIYNGGIANNTSIFAGSYIDFWPNDDGYARNTNIYAGGSMLLSNGAVHRGHLSIADGGVVSAYSGARIDFSLEDCTDKNKYLINDLSKIIGSATYTITAPVTVKNGTYKLAQTVNSFTDSAISIYCGSNIFGSVKVNGPDFTYSGKTYSLDLLNGNLTLTVSGSFSGKIQNLTGDSNGVSWDSFAGVDRYLVEYSKDNFAHTFSVETESNKLDTVLLSAGTYQWRVKAVDGAIVSKGENISAGSNHAEPQKIVSDRDGNEDIFFAKANEVWKAWYAAQHSGNFFGWNGTEEQVNLAGKNKIADVFEGSTDTNVLVLTDDTNGDALFIEDIYTSFGKDAARIAQIDEIRAGAGDDIIDMTSQKFAYAGDGVKIYGGQGNDTIWANNGENTLFGDAGIDRIVGSTGFDLIVGGAGNDSMHSGGGNDIFAFCENWGVDTVEITDNAYITLWFASGNASNWDAGKRVYRDGSNSVTVIGGANSTIDLKFGNAGGQYSDMVDIGAFESAASEKIFEDKNNGMLA